MNKQLAIHDVQITYFLTHFFLLLLVSVKSKVGEAGRFRR